MTFTMGLLLGAALTVWLLATIATIVKVIELEERQMDHRVDTRESFERLEELIAALTKRVDGHKDSLTFLHRERMDHWSLLRRLTEDAERPAKKPAQPTMRRKRAYRRGTAA